MVDADADAETTLMTLCMLEAMVLDGIPPEHKEKTEKTEKTEAGSGDRENVSRKHRDKNRDKSRDKNRDRDCGPAYVRLGSILEEAFRYGTATTQLRR